jgi:hypothetical protein
MAVQTSYPGVYVQEVPSGVRTITGVSTSTTLFIGGAVWGPVNEPVLCLNYSDFERTFTSSVAQGDLARSVRLFFLNGGTRCYIMRVGAENDPTPADNVSTSTVTLNDGAAAATLIVNARYPGALGDSIRVVVEHPAASPTEFDLTLFRLVPKASGGFAETDKQTWKGLSMDPVHPRYAIKYVDYKWAVLEAPAPANTNRPAATPSASLTNGGDGVALVATDYDYAYTVIEKNVDLFNLMVLTRNSTGVVLKDLWGNASVFCQKKRAFLLMDPEDTWTTVQAATNNTVGVSTLRTGLVSDHSAVFHPKLLVNENSVSVEVGPSGAMAGLMARIDASRGVWKAPAGTEADIRGIKGLKYRFSDDENGVLNQRAVNTIRIFPNGIVNWGARTMDGDDDFGSEYKYIPIRRTALFIEESLYRGLKWVVFEPNDEPLWAQIRLNVGAFMHDLFRQGAFQGKTKQEAYFVKCDSETTTQNDINLGIVNVWVGFAPLKPAEFVVLYLQQMTGQIQV